MLVPHKANCTRYTRENVKSPIKAAGDLKLVPWLPPTELTAIGIMSDLVLLTRSRGSSHRHQPTGSHLEFRGAFLNGGSLVRGLYKKVLSSRLPQAG
jgi:hypothetical protein